MQKIEKYRKFIKYFQTIGMVVILGIAAVFLFIFRNQSETDVFATNSMYFIFGAIAILFIFMMFVITPMQSKLLKMVILASLDNLVSDVKFNKKKGYSKENFIKLGLVPNDVVNYNNFDYYSFNYKGEDIESVTIKAFDEFKVPTGKGKKTTKKEKVYFFGRLYIIPFKPDVKFSVFSKIKTTDDFKKTLDYKNELPLKVKKYSDAFQVFYNDEKPDVTNFIDKLLTLKIASKGQVFAFVKSNSIIIAINNSHHYKELEVKNPIDESLIRDYRKDVSMVLTFINSIKNK